MGWLIDYWKRLMLAVEVREANKDSLMSKGHAAEISETNCRGVGPR